MEEARPSSSTKTTGFPVSYTHLQVQIFWLHPTGEMVMENLTFENIKINGEIPYNLIKLTPTLTLVGTSPLKQPTPNNVKVGSGRRGIGSRGYGEFVVVPVSYTHLILFGVLPVSGRLGKRLCPSRHFAFVGSFEAYCWLGEK